jgi:beta-lactamase class A
MILPLLLLAALPAGADTGAAPEGFRDALWSKLEATIEREDARLDGVLGVALLDLTSGRTLLRNADLVYPTASSIKIAVLAELYRQCEVGRLKLSDPYLMDAKDLVADSRIMAGLTPGVTQLTNGDLAQLMVAVSDNAATNVLIERVGMENVNLLLDRLGLAKTRLRRKMIDLVAAREGRENVSTPREMIALLEAIFRGKLLGASASEALLQRLSTLKQDYFRLPEDVQAANKPGELEGVRNDIGIIYATKRPFALAVMTTGDADERAAEATIGRIAAAAYETLDRIGRASPYGRVISPRSSR